MIVDQDVFIRLFVVEIYTKAKNYQTFMIHKLKRYNNNDTGIKLSLLYHYFRKDESPKTKLSSVSSTLLRYAMALVDISYFGIATHSGATHWA